MSLRGREQFDRVMTEGRRACSGPVAVIVAPGSDPGGALGLGLAVASRGGGGSVRRNRIRRRIKAAARSTGIGGRDVVVRGDERTLTLDFQELVDSLRDAITRAEVRR